MQNKLSVYQRKIFKKEVFKLVRAHCLPTLEENYNLKKQLLEQCYKNSTIPEAQYNAIVEQNKQLQQEVNLLKDENIKLKKFLSINKLKKMGKSNLEIAQIFGDYHLLEVLEKQESELKYGL